MFEQRGFSSSDEITFHPVKCENSNDSFPTPRCEVQHSCSFLSFSSGVRLPWLGNISFFHILSWRVLGYCFKAEHVCFITYPAEELFIVKLHNLAKSAKTKALRTELAYSFRGVEKFFTFYGMWSSVEVSKRTRHQSLPRTAYINSISLRSTP